MPRGRRRPLAVTTLLGLGGAALISCLAGRWCEPAPPRPRATAAAPAPPSGSAASAVRRPPRPGAPRLQVAAETSPAGPPPAMAEGLAQDLDMFDGTQLRAELESIALSYPGVRIVEALCTRPPCRARSAGGDLGELTTFVVRVNERFQGHVETHFHAPAAGSAGERQPFAVSLLVGTPERHPAPPPPGGAAPSSPAPTP